MAIVVVATYDIRNDARRARVAAQLQRWGDRIQYSVFTCVLERERLDELVDTIRSIIDVDEDSFFVFRQCGLCEDGLISLGQAATPHWERYWAVW